MAKKKTGRRGGNMFSLASKNKSYRSAKRAAEKAASRASRAYAAALRIAKKKIRKRK